MQNAKQIIVEKVTKTAQKHQFLGGFWKGRLKSIFSFQQKMPPTGRHTNREPSGAGRGW